MPLRAVPLVTKELSYDYYAWVTDTGPLLVRKNSPQWDCWPQKRTFEITAVGSLSLVKMTHSLLVWDGGANRETGTVYRTLTPENLAFFIGPECRMVDNGKRRLVQILADWDVRNTLDLGRAYSDRVDMGTRLWPHCRLLDTSEWQIQPDLG